MPPARPAHILPVTVLAQFAGTSLWFSGNAVLPDLQRALDLGNGGLAAITSAVQLGFILGTLVFAIWNIADRWRPRDVFLSCALLGALANAAVLSLPRFAHGHYPALLALRFSTGFFLAGIYPVGMKIAASWYREGLGTALGWLVGALVLGTALPHLLRGSIEGEWALVMGAVSLLAVAGALALHRWVPEGPNLAPAPRFEPAAVLRAFRHADFRASAFGYFGHMWELYTLWAFLPLMLVHYNRLHGGAALDPALTSFAIIAVGALGCIGGGLLSRRAGSARVAFAQLAVSGLCCLASPIAYALPPAGFLAFMLVWGIAVVGDSPQFSALNAATAPRAFVGSALTIANCIGFSISVVSLQAATWLGDRLPMAWWFVPVAVGPALGLVACARLARRPPG